MVEHTIWLTEIESEVFHITHRWLEDPEALKDILERRFGRRPLRVEDGQRMQVTFQFDDTDQAEQFVQSYYETKADVILGILEAMRDGKRTPSPE